MYNSVLYTYSSIDELRQIQAEKDVQHFMFVTTKTVIDMCPDVCIDITALVYFLESNRSNIQSVYVNFEGITDETLLIANAEVASKAVELLPHIFSRHQPYYEQACVSEEAEPILPSAVQLSRRCIYKYNSSADLERIIKYAHEHHIPIATFSRASTEFRKEFDQFNRSAEIALLDLTSISYALEDSKQLIYPFEQYIGLMSNISVIAQATRVDALLEYFPLYFEGQLPISKLLPDLVDMDEPAPTQDSFKNITSLSREEFERFMDRFDHELVGHRYFKGVFRRALKNFVALNKAHEQKVFSVFLFGASGIGKTEVARILSDSLMKGCYLAKINFQNYSSQDALNSLIGSPAGYVGCNNGELSEKINKSKVGILLCDEFEKTTRPVFSFFLELLEEGRFTDSMAREYDLDGYIIVFTSNIQNESDYKKLIPPELQTRFDLVCEFQVPSHSEKRVFLELLLSRAQETYANQFSQFQFSDADKTELFNFDYSGLSALRDIKRVFNSRLMDLFERKNVLLF